MHQILHRRRWREKLGQLQARNLLMNGVAAQAREAQAMAPIAFSTGGRCGAEARTGVKRAARKPVLCGFLKDPGSLSLPLSLQSRVRESRTSAFGRVALCEPQAGDTMTMW